MLVEQLGRPAERGPLTALSGSTSTTATPIPTSTPAPDGGWYDFCIFPVLKSII